MRLAKGVIILCMPRIPVYNYARRGWERRIFLISLPCLMLVKADLLI